MCQGIRCSTSSTRLSSDQGACQAIHAGETLEFCFRIDAINWTFPRRGYKEKAMSFVGPTSSFLSLEWESRWILTIRSIRWRSTIVRPFSEWLVLPLDEGYLDRFLFLLQGTIPLLSIPEKLDQKLSKCSDNRDRLISDRFNPAYRLTVRTRPLFFVHLHLRSWSRISLTMPIFWPFFLNIRRSTSFFVNRVSSIWSNCSRRHLCQSLSRCPFENFNSM